MENKLTFEDEIQNVIGCLESLMSCVEQYEDECNTVYLTETEVVLDDAKKSLEFLDKLPEIVYGACVLACYCASDEANRYAYNDTNADCYGFGADGYEWIYKYVDGGIELAEEFGKEDFYNTYWKYADENIVPKGEE